MDNSFLREVAPNVKCNGCFHYDKNKLRLGACTVALQPATCGDGNFPTMGYAPMDKLAVMDTVDHATNAMVHTPAFDGSAPRMKAPGTAGQINVPVASLGEEHVDMVKSIVASMTEAVQRECPKHQQHGTPYGMSSSPDAPMQGLLPCRCTEVSSFAVAKALVHRLPNALVLRVKAPELLEFVEDIRKGGGPRRPAVCTACNGAKGGNYHGEWRACSACKGTGKRGGMLRPHLAGNYPKPKATKKSLDGKFDLSDGGVTKATTEDVEKGAPPVPAHAKFDLTDTKPRPPKTPQFASEPQATVKSLEKCKTCGKKPSLCKCMK